VPGGASPQITFRQKRPSRRHVLKNAVLGKRNAVLGKRPPALEGWRQNQKSDPQLGQGASPGGSEGSRQNGFRQMRQRAHSPSGVRDEMIAISTSLETASSLGERPSPYFATNVTKMVCSLL
jgi:hypothetical protein